MSDKPWLYIHGFNSSGASQKAQQLRTHCASQGRVLLAPDLSNDPQQALAQLLPLAEQAGLIIGSSLGGFYALVLASVASRPTVLINPALWPQQQLAPLLGAQRHYHSGQHWTLTQTHLQAWRQQSLAINWQAEQLHLWLQTGDDVIPYAPSVRALPTASSIIEQGGDHGFQALDRYYPLLEQLLHDSDLQHPSH